MQADKFLLIIRKIHKHTTRVIRRN